MVLLNPKQQTLMRLHKNTYKEVTKFYEIDTTYPKLPNYFRDLTPEQYEYCKEHPSWKVWEDLDNRLTLEKSFSNS